MVDVVRDDGNSSFRKEVHLGVKLRTKTVQDKIRGVLRSIIIQNSDLRNLVDQYGIQDP